MSMKAGIREFGRRFAAANIFDGTCKVERVSGSKALDEATGLYVDVLETIHASLPCRVKNPYRAPTSETTMGQVQEQSMAELQLPVEGSEGIRAHDLVTILSSESDPDLPGMEYSVAVRKAESDSILRRIPVLDPN